MAANHYAYGRDHLIALASVLGQTSYPDVSCLTRRLQLNPDVLRLLRRLQISRTHATRRGKKGGRRKQRKQTDRSGFSFDSDIPAIDGSQIVPNQSARQKCLKVVLWNAQSVRNKSLEIFDFILDSNLDIFFITETWLRQLGDESKCAELTPDGYKCIHIPRAGRIGGGLALIYRRGLLVDVSSNLYNYPSFETLTGTITSGKLTLKFICIYRPPPSKANAPTDSIFLEDFASLCDALGKKMDRTIVLGDFNVHFESTENTLSKRMHELLESRCLVQHVVDPTHRSGHTLDWVVSRDSSLLKGIEVLDMQMSDHFMVHFDLEFSRPPVAKKLINKRNMKGININCFKDELQNSTLLQDPPANVEHLVEHLNSTLIELLDKHAPLKTKKVRPHDTSPWYNAEVRKAKADRRAVERLWRKSQLEIHRQMYKASRNKVNKLIRQAKSDYINEEIAENSSNPKLLFSTLDRLLGKSRDILLPRGDEAKLTEDFCTYFSDKITNLRQDLGSDNSAQFEEACGFQGTALERFTPLTNQDVLKLIRESKATSCQLDPIPTTFLIELLDVLCPTITRIVNASLKSGIVPHSFKSAVIKPYLKKSTLDTQVLKNYRPVSNLPFLSKILEKAVKNQITKHLDRYNLIDNYQSAYRTAHSTETALNCVINNLRMMVDKGDIAMLVLLDLSAAFDTIDHDRLLERLSAEYGFTGTVLKWCSSYLAERIQSVTIGQSKSHAHRLTCGVPQGSVLGPILFSLYTKPLGSIISDQKVAHHFYADDSQLSDSFTLDKHNQANKVANMETCISRIRSWMNINMLKLNDDKTEAMLIAPPARLKQCSLDNLAIGDAVISFSPKAKNLGVVLDSGLTMNQHVNHLCKTCYFHLRNIGSIRHLITRDSAATLARSLILSRLDYCNSLLTGLSANQLYRLQKIQNQAARIVSRTKLRYHISPVLDSLHWLRVGERIQFKTLTLAYQCVNKTAPMYLQDLVSQYTQTRTLRSNTKHLLNIPAHRLKTFGSKSFQSAAASLWNDLPLSVKTSPSLTIFKSRLKTHLFDIRA